MTNEEIKRNIFEFFKQQKLAVISTVDSDGKKPESAVIAFAEKETLELVFGTSNTTRKYKYLQINPHVSFVVGWDGSTGTIQYEGIAAELSGEEAQQSAEVLILKNKQSEKFRARTDQRYFLVRPTWIRFLDMSKKPEELHEITF